METIKVNRDCKKGRIKPMHAVNNNPLKPRADQTKSFFDDYKAAGIPYARNHDASHWAGAGREHVVDVNCIFTDFDRDVNDPSAYDFTLTDVYVNTCFDAGAEVFYRLGASIEHWVKKYNTLPPADNQKWAEICEHIIMHYNEGWADGFRLGITYWEIWNEPDLNQKKCWGGTWEEFYELFAVTAAHLKKRFPQLKIGGPAICGIGDTDFTEGLLKRLKKDNIPLDFFSWHLYGYDTSWYENDINKVRNILDKYGYTETESILNEWNYVKDWSDKYVYSIEQIIGMKGAAFTAAVMLIGQENPLDMLMYYDARPSAFNGMFDFYTDRPLKGYYPFKMFNNLYRKGIEAETDCGVPGLYAATAVDEKGNPSTMIAYFSDDEESAEAKETEIVYDKPVSADVYILDSEHNAEKIFGFSGTSVRLTIKPNSVILISDNF